MRGKGGYPCQQFLAIPVNMRCTEGLRKEADVCHGDTHAHMSCDLMACSQMNRAYSEDAHSSRSICDQYSANLLLDAECPIFNGRRKGSISGWGSHRIPVMCQSGPAGLES
jgi:hypothetical protein